MRTIKATWPAPVTSTVRIVGSICAIVFLAMAVGQLFDYEVMPEIIAGNMNNDIALATVTAAILVVIEMLAIPFLLGMQLSWLMRFTSLLCGLGAILYWLSVAINAAANDTVDNLGVFGDHLTVQSSWWLLVPMIIFMLLFVWYIVKSSLFQLPHHLENSSGK